ncbi:MAG: cyclic nucleotide-binding domain-containing protein, partial [Myxococcales bacterium]|nr:cyclic nucleotide-binding domain-containing protein [Myxococcales bacterium]
HERVLLEGRAGDSLFVVAEGQVEVLSRDGDADRELARLGVGSIVGERAVLTASRRAATVRAGTEGALVLEIAGDDLRPLFGEHPELVVALALLHAERNPVREDSLSAGLVRRLRRWIAGDALAAARS